MNMYLVMEHVEDAFEEGTTPVAIFKTAEAALKFCDEKNKAYESFCSRCLEFDDRVSEFRRLNHKNWRKDYPHKNALYEAALATEKAKWTLELGVTEEQASSIGYDSSVHYRYYELKVID